MNLKSLLAGAAMALSAALMAGSASAATVTGNISDGNNGSDLLNGVADSGAYDALAGPYTWSAVFVDSDGAGQATFQFTNTSATSIALTAAVVTINQLVNPVTGAPILYFAGGVTTQWVGGLSQVTAAGVDSSFTLLHILGAGQTATLLINFTDPIGANGVGPDIDLTVVADTVVPIPAALPLLASGLLGMGFLARRRKAAAQGA